jgi:hypothetical protein
MRTRRRILADEAEDLEDDVILCVNVPKRSRSATPIDRRKRSRIVQRQDEPVEYVQLPAKKQKIDYRKGTKHQSWDESWRLLAIQAVKDGQMSQHAAAKYYEFPKSTLNDRLKGKV